MDYLGCFSCLFAPVPLSIVWVVSAYCIILSWAHAEMLAIHLGIFPLSAEVANQTNIVFQNATLGVRGVNPKSIFSQEKKNNPKSTQNPHACRFNSTESDWTVYAIKVFWSLPLIFSYCFLPILKANRIKLYISLFTCL